MSPRRDVPLPTEHTNFHPGTRIVDEFVLSLHGGKAQLSCTIEETWDEILLRVLSCGTKYSRTLTRRRGCTRIDEEDLESALDGTLGIPGLGTVKASIKQNTGVETHFEEVREDQETSRSKLRSAVAKLSCCIN